MNIIDKVRNAGIVGCGGAGFPTHIKYDTHAKWLIINAAECEPLLRTDRYLMKNESVKLIRAAEAIGKHLGSEHIVIATKESYEKELFEMRKTISELCSPVKIHTMKSFYPAGDEQVIVYEVTGNIVSPADLPSSVNAVVSNVGTLCGVYDAIEGRAFTHKYLTVTGEVAQPTIIKAPLGCSLRECIEAAGGRAKDCDFIVGGPMMGRFKASYEADDEVVTKTTSGIIVLPKDSGLARYAELPVSHMLHRAKSACIQCNFCTQMCSRHMLGHPIKPHKIMRKLSLSSKIEELLDDEDVKQAMICSECGICEEYACPMGLQPRRINSMLKSVYRQEGVGYERKKEDCKADHMREYRKVPSERFAARMGLSKYYHIEIDKLIELNPSIVKIPVRQHIGVPSHVVVDQGDRVSSGQLIAECEAGKVGAHIHASIDGVVTDIGDRIVIERK